MESILIIDDDVSLCKMLRDYFELQNMKLAMRHHGMEGFNEARVGNYDLILLDVVLPGIDGLEVLRRLRAASEVSVLMLTSRSETDDRIIGLDNGADDYVPKPFNPRELLSRIRAVLRRRSRVDRSNVPPVTATRRALHGYVLDATARSASYQGTSLSVTEIEYALLEALLESAGEVLTRDALFERILQRSFNPFDRSLDMLVSRLRRKLALGGKPGGSIKAIRNSGYLLLVPERF